VEGKRVCLPLSRLFYFIFKVVSSPESESESEDTAVMSLTCVHCVAFCSWQQFSAVGIYYLS
jgi:hypothetical protein